MTHLPCGCAEGVECAECAAMTEWIRYREATEAWECDRHYDAIEIASQYA